MQIKRWPSKILKNNKGQALFEMVIFLPFLVILYSIFYTIGNSINGSINQQKAVRGYFYSLTKGNSYINTYADLLQFKGESFNKVGFSSVGWREKSTNQGKASFAPCFKFIGLLKAGEEEECDVREKGEDSSKIIRAYTFYGVCGPVYTTENGVKFFGIFPPSQTGVYDCAITK